MAIFKQKLTSSDCWGLQVNDFVLKYNNSLDRSSLRQSHPESKISLNFMFSPVSTDSKNDL